MTFTETALLASIDETLASIKAALVAAEDPEQTAEARTELAARAAADSARLVMEADPSDWPGVDPAILDAVRGIEQPAHQGDLEEMRRRLARAREMLGGPSA
ncbi:MAG TPA: hypothetical protein VGR37_19770 [Longimicrobiaceae bacterium]|nr:hypothetical protein [Longimicrobiaceae bacterium]